MEGLKLKHDALIQMLVTLHEAILLMDSSKYPELYKNLRDSAIQRFEYSIDGFWKYLKLYLQVKHEVLIENITPRAVLREALNADLITDQEFNILIDGIGRRNLTSHSYNESVAHEIAQNIPEAYAIMKNIVDRISF